MQGTDGTNSAPRQSFQGGPPQGHLRGQERHFGIVLLLYIVTFGIYGLWWHYKTHDELCQQTGRINRDKGLLLAYVVVALAALAFTVWISIHVAEEIRILVDQAREPTADEIFAIVTSAIWLVIVWMVAGLTQLVLLILYVVRQFRLLADVVPRMQLQSSIEVGGFLGLYLGGVAAEWFVPILGTAARITMHIIAFYQFQDTYNRIWRALQAGARIPSDAEWAAAAPGAYGVSAPPAGGSPLAAPQPTSTPHGGTRARTWAPGHIEQAFSCPRCHAHIPASGPPGAAVAIRCAQCGETGNVTLPGAGPA